MELSVEIISPKFSNPGLPSKSNEQRGFSGFFVSKSNEQRLRCNYLLPVAPKKLVIFPTFRDFSKFFVAFCTANQLQYLVLETSCQS
jgi:hypothetical protein